MYLLISIAVQYPGKKRNSLREFILFSERTETENSFQEAACCENRSDLVSCEQINFNISILWDHGPILVNNIRLTWQKTSVAHTQIYKTDGNTDALINYDNRTGNVFALVKSDDGRSFSIHRCKDIHILEEFDVQKLIEREHENDFIPDENPQERTWPYPSSGKIELPDFDLFPAVPFSVKFYYTPEFAEHKKFENDEERIQKFFLTMIDLTNAGFHNSKLPIVMTMNCYEKATISDREAANITAFELMKGNVNELRQSADIAILVTLTLFKLGTQKEICGQANTRVCVVQVTCAKSEFSIGHEIGHILGGHHPNGFMFLESVEDKWIVRRTIMAYHVPGYNSTRYNQYSSPRGFKPKEFTDDNVLKKNGSNAAPKDEDIDGYSGEISTADLIWRNIKRISEIGDESESCLILPKERKSEQTWNNHTDLVIGPTHITTNESLTLAQRRIHFCNTFPKHCEPGHTTIHGRHGELVFQPQIIKPLSKSCANCSQG